MNRLELIRKVKQEMSSEKKDCNCKKKSFIDPNPCWEGYEPIGLKDDGSPNCVPIKEEQSKVKQGFPIPSPSGDEDEKSFIGRCVSEIGGEYGQEQALAICIKKYTEK